MVSSPVRSSIFFPQLTFFLVAISVDMLLEIPLFSLEWTQHLLSVNFFYFLPSITHFVNLCRSTNCKVIVLQCKTCNKICGYCSSWCEMNFIRLSHDGVTLDATSSSGDEVNCLRVAICSTLVRCCQCISILIIRAVRWCSLIGPH